MTSRRRNSAAHPAALVKVHQAFERLKIKPPPIPARFRDHLRPIGDWCFASRDIDPMRMYFFDHALLEGVAPEMADYVAFSHAGQGANSYGLTYHLIDGPLVMMVQSIYGGVYGDEPQDRKRANALFRRCEALTGAMSRARDQGLPETGRLVVVESLFRHRYAWGWLREPLSEGAAWKDWLHQHEVAADAGADKPLPEERLPTNAARQWLETASFTPEELHGAGLRVRTSVQHLYPEPKARELSPQEKQRIRERLAAGDADIFKVAAEFGCSASQVAGIKAWLKR